MKVTLSDGRAIGFDWHKITQKEWRLLLDVKTDVDTNDALVGKLIGMTADEVGGLNPLDYRCIAVGLWDDFRESSNLDDSKNSQGASSSPS